MKSFPRCDSFDETGINTIGDHDLKSSRGQLDTVTLPCICIGGRMQVNSEIVTRSMQDGPTHHCYLKRKGVLAEQDGDQKWFG